ncbi:MAG: hypothetical protein GY793_04635 [Proteobacteria bacterium]|nr:hypothetical protein [Pseudomonadota bacterium]
MKKLLLVTLYLVMAQSAVEKANAQVCLDYWLKGPSACKQQQNKNKVTINGNITAGKIKKTKGRIKYERNLNVKIDKFIAGYGKPPREFIAFHLDPTMENAIRWVKKFNEDHERTMKIAVAWKQADELFRSYRDTGELTLPAESGVTVQQLSYLREALDEEASDLPKVKGFGVNIEGDWDEDRLSRNYTTLKFKEKDFAKAASKLSNTGKESSFSLGSLSKKVGFKTASNTKIKETTKVKTKQKVKTGNQFPLEVSYYFSKKCAFCVKYTESIKTAVKNIGSKNIKLTCVDMTPGAKDPSNKGSLDCKWRPVTKKELKKFGVKRTPSMIVKRPGSNALELLENYHNAKVLEKYLRYGTNKR